MRRRWRWDYYTCLGMAKVLGIESSCDETAAAVVGPAKLSFPASSPRRLTRTASTAASSPNWPRANTYAPSCRSSAARSSRPASAGTISTRSPSPSGPAWSGSSWSGLPTPRPFSGPGDPAHRRQPYRRPHPRRARWSRASGGVLEYPALALVASGGHTHLFESPPQVSIACSAKPATMPPAKPTTRSPSCSASATPADPCSTSLAPYGDPDAVRSRCRR